jgi:hypothetical protein
MTLVRIKRSDPHGLSLEEERRPERIRTAPKPGKGQYWLARKSRRSLIPGCSEKFFVS